MSSLEEFNNSADESKEIQSFGVEMGHIEIDDSTSLGTEQVETIPFSPKALKDEPGPVTLAWHNLTVVSTNHQKVLLDNVSGSISGGFWAVMGASGGGKTTLLSTLSLRIASKSIEVTGDLRLNGATYSRQFLKSMSGYVMQDDLLRAELTVKETLYYESQLRLPNDATQSERAARVDELLELFGISHCSDVIIGDTRRKGISGGERKRVCIAIELLMRPKLLFLDEPTSGLDSTTALSVCQTLKKLSDSGNCTVICTIHQPQQKIFELFDNLILMKKGKIVYLGDCAKSVNFLSAVGLPCPPGVNPADHLLDVISPSKENGAIGPINSLTNEIEILDDENLIEQSTKATWLTQFKTIAIRSLIQYIRRTDMILLQFFATVAIACFVGGSVWYQQPFNQTTATTTILPSLFFACVTQGVFGSLQAINNFPSERAVMMRERASGSYTVSAYFVAKSAVDILIQIWPPIVFSCIAYFMMGYKATAGKFFTYMAFMILDSLAATSLAVMVTCYFVTVERASVLLAFFFEVSRLYGGFFISPSQMVNYPGWYFAYYLSYVKYAYVGVALNELSDISFSCPSGATNCITSGTELDYIMMMTSHS